MEIVFYILGTIVLVLLVGIFCYNQLVIRKNDVHNSFASIDAMLKKRYDLLPNLVTVTQQYMNYEKNILAEITSLRSLVESNLSAKEKVEKYNQLQKHADHLMLTVENYPDLKANKNFIDLQKVWNTTEEQISASRRFFNTAVTDYNIAIQAFPSNIIAKMFGFKEMNVFEVSENERVNPSAKELFAS
jgi:LemA protein